MEQPAYFNDGTSRVCKLLKSLYGLKQSPLLWYSALDSVLIGGGCSRSQVDEALYFNFGADGVGCWLLAYVDDLLAARSSLEMLKDLRELLQNAFELREITPVQNYLRLEIVQDRSARKLWLHQSAYMDNLRRRFVDEEQTGRYPKTPISVDAYTELTFDDEEYQAREEEYRQKVGLLLFAATTTRPDIAYACSKLGSGLTICNDQHWRELDRCIDYMVNTRDFTLKRFLLAEFRLLDAGVPTVIHVDNSSAIAVAEGLGLKRSLKNMERCYIWLQQMVKRKKLALTYIPTSEQLADYLTKALHSPTFKRCSVAVGQVDLAGDERDNEPE
ncbi:unnamed protein product [Closterium sp. NIES-54]